MSRLTYTHTDYLIVFEECKLVQGYYSSLLYDLTRPDNSNEVPKSFVDFYKKAEVFNILELRIYFCSQLAIVEIKLS